MRRFEHPTPWRRSFVGWWKRPAGLLFGFALPVLILAAPAWLMYDELRSFAIFGDDFAYISESRDADTTFANLLAPHNTHIVPLFRLWTYGLIALSGDLERMQAVFGAASYVGLIAAMAAVGTFVKQETSRSGLALAAMTGLGVSTVVMPAVTWYSAGQALWAGTAIVLTLLSTRSWSIKGGGGRFALIILGLLAAPMIWTGGHVAGLAGAAYLSASNRPRARRGAVALVLVTALAILLELILVRRELRETSMIWEHHRELWPRPIQAVFHTVQAITEAILLGNIGLDAITSPFQASMIVLGVVALWAWTTGGRRAKPLTAAGAAILLMSYLMVYTFRGNLPFDSLRSVRWYHAIPQVGAILFAAGWWADLTPIPDHDGRRRLSRVGGLIVLGSLLVQCGMQRPRADRQLLATAPPMTESERRLFPIDKLQRLRAIHFLLDHQERQYRHLIRLNKAEEICERLGIGPEAIRRAFGRIIMPGMPELQAQSDVVAIMTLPPDTDLKSPDAVRSALGNLIAPEAEARPNWLSPMEPWPRPRPATGGD